MNRGDSMRTRSSLAVYALTFIAACPHRPAADTLAPVVSTARVYYDDGPAFRDSVRMVVKDITTWQNVWAQAMSTQSSPLALPSVDFGRDMILVVGGGRLTPGDQIHVDSAGTRGGYFVAVVRTIVQCRPFPADAYPTEIVKVKRSDRPAAFSERRERATNC